jgi:hypothetical protein
MMHPLFMAGVLMSTAPLAGTQRVRPAEPGMSSLAWIEAVAPGVNVDIRTVATSRGGLEIREIRGSHSGVPLARPLARMMVDVEGKRDVLVVHHGVVPPPNAIEPRITSDDAVTRVRRLGGVGSGGLASPELVLVPEGLSSRLVWRVDPPFDPVHLADPVFLVDALTGDVRLAHDKVRFAWVRAYSPNPVVAPRAAEYELVEIDAESPNLVGPSWQAINCVEPAADGPCTPVAIATADAEGNFLFPAPDIDVLAEATELADPFAEATAYYHADRFQAHLRDLGLPGIPCQTNGQTPTIVTNYGHFAEGSFVPFEDAVYVGQCNFTIALGQGPTLDLALEGDIVYHEIGHGVVQQAMGPTGFLGIPRHLPEALANDAGAINEAVSDFLSSSFTGDPYMGEYLRDYGVLSGGRDNANAFTCPSGLMGKVHEDGEPFAAALWASFEVLEIGFIRTVVDAVSLFPDDVGFEEAAEIIALVTGVELGESAEAIVREAFAVRGLTGCERIVPWAEIERGMWLFPPDLAGVYSPIRPPPYQVEIDVPADVNTLTLRLTLEDFLFEPGEPDARIGLLQKAGSPLTFTYQPGGSAVAVSYDADAEVEVPDLGDVELTVAEGKVYLAFVNVGTTVAILTDLEVMFDFPDGTSTTANGEGESGDEPAMGDTSTTGGPDETVGQHGGENGACACRTSGGPGLPGVLVLMVFMARRKTLHARCRPQG